NRSYETHHMKKNYVNSLAELIARNTMQAITGSRALVYKAGGMLLLMLTVLNNIQAQQGPAGIDHGVLLWLDAADVDADGNPANNQTAGNIVSWKDKSDNNHHANASIDAGTIVPNAINGNAVVRFTATGQYSGTVYIASGVDLRSGTNPDITIFTVYRQGTHFNTNEAVWGIDNGDWDRFFFTHMNIGSNNGGVSLGPSQQMGNVTGSGTVGALQLLTAVYDGNVSGSTNNGADNA